MIRTNFIPKLFTFGLAILSSTILVSAQGESKQTKPVKDPTPVQTETRSRRTSDSSKEKTVEPAAERQPVVTPAAVESEAKENPQVKDEPEETSPNPRTPEDPIAALREQIFAASTDTEKNRLQHELVGLLVSKGAKQEAINELRLMSVDDRFNPQGLYNIGNALARLNDGEGAIVAYRKAIDQRKGRYSRALNNLGVVLLRQGRWDESYEAFNSALKIESFRYAEASYNLGRLYAARGENDLAVREWKRAVYVNPEHKAAAQALARVGSAGRIEVATTGPAERISSRTPPSREREELPSAAKPAKAVKSASRTEILTVDHTTYTYLQRARSARERGRQDEAATNYRQVISRMGGYFGPANLELSYSLITLKRRDEAIASLLQVTEHDGARYPISYYHLARLYEAKGDLKLAEENYDRAATSYDGDNAQFLLDVSRVREKLGNLSGALVALEEYLTIMERKNLKPEWSIERLTALKQKLATSQPKP